MIRRERFTDLLQVLGMRYLASSRSSIRETLVILTCSELYSALVYIEGYWPDIWCHISHNPIQSWNNILPVNDIPKRFVSEYSRPYPRWVCVTVHDDVSHRLTIVMWLNWTDVVWHRQWWWMVLTLVDYYGPILEVLQYQANPWRERSKPLTSRRGPKISLISKHLDEVRIRY